MVLEPLPNVPLSGAKCSSWFVLSSVISPIGFSSEPERSVRSRLVVVFTPTLQLLIRSAGRYRRRHFQALWPQPAVQCFNHCPSALQAGISRGSLSRSGVRSLTSLRFPVDEVNDVERHERSAEAEDRYVGKLKEKISCHRDERDQDAKNLRTSI